MTSSLLVRPQKPAENAAISALHAQVFGPGRFVRTAFRIRETSTQESLAALTAWDGDTLVGAIQFTAITIGGQRGSVLLGPLAIAPTYQNNGCGLRLITEGLAAIKDLGAALVILVGDLLYYQKMGFQTVPPGQITLPGPVDPQRLLACTLKPGALNTYSGMVAADNMDFYL
jgi:predicted N-acetyltransferase YhbS